MASEVIVVYWHRFGLKVFRLNPTPVLVKEIESADPLEIEEQLKFIGAKKVYLLLSDTICYLFSKDLNPPLPLDTQFKSNLLKQIKSDIPEDFSEFSWDYKIDKNTPELQKVTVFAPIKEFQTSIDYVSQKLLINFIVVEPESISSTRDPNPIIGIVKKNDLGGKDEDILNLSITPTVKPRKSIIPYLLFLYLWQCFLVEAIIFTKLIDLSPKSYLLLPRQLSLLPP